MKKSKRVSREQDAFADIRQLLKRKAYTDWDLKQLGRRAQRVNTFGALLTLYAQKHSALRATFGSDIVRQWLPLWTSGLHIPRQTTVVLLIAEVFGLSMRERSALMVALAVTQQCRDLALLISNASVPGWQTFAQAMLGSIEHLLAAYDGEQSRRSRVEDVQRNVAASFAETLKGTDAERRQYELQNLYLNYLPTHLRVAGGQLGEEWLEPIAQRAWQAYYAQMAMMEAESANDTSRVLALMALEKNRGQHDAAHPPNQVLPLAYRGSADATDATDAGEADGASEVIYLDAVSSTTQEPATDAPEPGSGAAVEAPLATRGRTIPLTGLEYPLDVPKPPPETKVLPDVILEEKRDSNRLEAGQPSLLAQVELFSQQLERQTLTNQALSHKVRWLSLWLGVAVMLSLVLGAISIYLAYLHWSQPPVG